MSVNKERIRILAEEPVFTAILKMALPVMLGMIIQVFYNMVDTFFIGRLNDANQLAAASLGFPLFMILMSVGGVIGMGASSLISRFLGAQRNHEAGEAVALAMVLNIAFAAAVTLLGLLFLDPLVGVLGARDAVAGPTRDYLFPLIAGSVVILGNFSFGIILRAEGAAMRAMYGMIIGTVVNIILDPIMIFTLGMGIQGAAIATIIGNLAGLLWYLSTYLGKSILKPVFDCGIFRSELLGQTLAIGIPSGLNQALMAAAGIVTNNLAAAYGAYALGGMGVAQRVYTLAILLLIGLAAGTQPLVGFNYGAGNRDRVRAILKTGMTMAVVIGIVLLGLFTAIGRPFIGLFSDLEELVDRGAWVLQAVTLSAPIVGIVMISMNSLQALGKAKPSLLLSVGRQGLFYIPILFLLNGLFGFDGLVFTQPVVDLFMAALSLLMLRSVFRRDSVLATPERE